MKVMIVAPHADDEVIGVGGSIAKHVKNGDKVYVVTVTCGDPQVYTLEYSEKCLTQQREAHDALGIECNYCLRFSSPGMNINTYDKVADCIKKLTDLVRPELVYIPHYGDMHYEHRMVAECCMVALRPKEFSEVEILAYEVPSETGWNVPCQQNEFIPNVYVKLEEGEMLAKLEALKKFELQMNKYPSARSVEAIENLARYRGTTVGTEFAEAFMLIRKQRS